MKFRYPVSSSMRSRAAADGRSRGSFCAVVGTVVLVTDAVSHPAAEAKCGLPGRVRRRDPPGVRWRPGDWHAPPTGYLQEATRDTRGPDDGACAGLGYARQPRPRPCSPRSRPARARGGRAGRAGDQRPAAALPGGRRAGSVRTPSASASVRLREAQAITAALAGPRQRQARVGQTLIRARPLRRRAARIARPARVRMRSRNPCVFARRRLFGWNVRLLTWDSRWTGRGRCGHRASHAGRAHAAARPGDSRTNERYAGRVPPVKPAPRHAGPVSAAGPAGRRLLLPAQPRRLVKQPRRYPPQHFPFAKRAPKSGPRLWTAVPGEGIRDRKAFGISQSPAAMGRAAAPSATCTTCGKTC
jgi:hypothetical protein